LFHRREGRLTNAPEQSATLAIKEMQTKMTLSQTLVAHTCNPSYSGGKDQEDCGSKTALKKNITKKKLVEWLKK
jgi:hypothetical protein